MADETRRASVRVLTAVLVLAWGGVGGAALSGSLLDRDESIQRYGLDGTGPPKRVVQKGVEFIVTNTGRTGPLAFLLFVGLAVIGPVVSAAGGDVPASIRDRYDLVRSLTAELEEDVSAAREQDLDTSREETAVALARIYVECAVWDALHEDVLEKNFAVWAKSRGRRFAHRGGKRYKPAEEARRAPVRMLEQLVRILRTGLKELDLEKSKKLSRPRYRVADTSKLAISRGYIRQGDRPVFLAGLNVSSLAENYPHRVIPENFVTMFLWMGALQEGQRPMDERHLRGFKRTLDRHRKNNVKIDILIGSSLPKWAARRNPDLKKTHGHSADFDIDHPKAREITARYLRQILPELKPYEENILSFCLANEPAWLTSNESWVLKNVGTVSVHTMRKYRTHLERKYRTITTLNRVWGADLASFSDIKTHARDNKNAARWYDWCVFNQKRCTDWFAFLRSEVRSVFPDAKCHVKVVNEQTVTGAVTADGAEDAKKLPNRHNGIDREAIIELTEINGCDTRILPGIDFPVRHPWDASASYGIQWLGQSIAFDLQKSLAPDKLLYDSEWHSQTTMGFRDPDMPGAHMKASCWLAHMYGMGASIVWYWGRSGAALRSWAEASFASFCFSPESMNSYFRSVIDANALSPYVEAIASAPRQVGILYSEPSAIYSMKHVNTTLGVYEALTFLGVKPGFVTENMLAGGKGSSYPWIIVPMVECARDATVQRLSHLAKKGTKITFAGSGCLTRDEYGRRRKAPIPGSLRRMKVLRMRKVQEMMDILAREKPDSIQPAVLCLDRRGSPRFGVICRSARTRKGYLAALVNVLKVETSVVMKGPGRVASGSFRRVTRRGNTALRGTDLLTGKTVGPGSITLQPNEVLLLSLHAP